MKQANTAFLGSVEYKSSRIGLQLGKPGPTSPIKAQKGFYSSPTDVGTRWVAVPKSRREPEFVGGMCRSMGMGWGLARVINTSGYSYKKYILTNTLRVTYEAIA